MIAPAFRSPWPFYFSGRLDFERIFAGDGDETDYEGQAEATLEERAESEEREEKPEGPPRCMAGSATRSPCGREATSRLGKTLLCHEHARMPGASEEVSIAEGAVFWLKTYQKDAHRNRNDVLAGLLADALDEAEDLRREAYEGLEVAARVRPL